MKAHPDGKDGTVTDLIKRAVGLANGIGGDDEDTIMDLIAMLEAKDAEIHRQRKTMFKNVAKICDMKAVVKTALEFLDAFEEAEPSINAVTLMSEIHGASYKGRVIDDERKALRKALAALDKT